MTEAEKNDIVKLFTTKFKTGEAWNLKCPMCGCLKFTLVDGYILFAPQDSPKNLVIGGKTMPTIGMICDSCGFLSSHVLGVLKKDWNKTENE